MIQSSIAYRSSERAFSLIEVLVTLAVLGVISSMVVSNMSNLGLDASRMVARQQQVAVQNAVQAWVASQMRVTNDPDAPKTMSLESVRSTYNGAGHSKARLFLVASYLDDTSSDHLLTATSNTGKIKSDALNKIRYHLVLDTWGSTTYPKVEMLAD
jgi:prepilin-type N-terminal cleavage/methylation domain-containing protein